MANEDLDNVASRSVCVNCIGDTSLQDLVRSEGKKGQCSYCRLIASTFTLEDLADTIHKVLEEQFYLTESEPMGGTDYALAKEGLWERVGQPVTDVIAEITGLDDSIAEDARTYLSHLHGEDPYTEDAHYKELEPDSSKFLRIWESFRQQVQLRARFFNRDAEEYLQFLFGGLTSEQTHDGTSVIREVSTSDDDRFVYRARTADSIEKLFKILEHPARELGAPLPPQARAGRMNAAGISVFYGALQGDTCVAEIRPPVGGWVVLARYEFIRPVRLFDLDALAKVYVEGSRFNEWITMLRERAAFLRHLAYLIGRPVMRGDETFEYLPTQIFAEYLAKRLPSPADGMLFRSSQTDGQGRNLVLFNHASVEEPDETKFIVRMNSGPIDDPLPAISMLEEAPPNESQVKNEEDNIYLPSRMPTLRLDKESIRVLRITAVNHNSAEIDVMLSRKNK